MSNGIKLDSQLYDFTTNCVGCAGCTFSYREAEFQPVCPIYRKFNFFTYSLGGMARIARALHEGRIDLTESVSEVVYRCTSCGACAIILASEEKAKRLSKKPVWIKDHITVHREGYVPLSGIDPLPSEPTQTVAARKLFKRNGITKPRKEIQVFEMYDPSAFAQMHWGEKFLLFEPGQAWRAEEKGTTSREGEFPISPSGGVLCTNPIGASGVIRVAEAALQIREDAGDHQVTRRVNQALVSGWGGADWTDLLLLSKSK